MILTWFRLWPVLVVAFLLPFIIGFFPSIKTRAGEIGGADFRYNLFSVVYDLSPDHLANYLVSIYEKGGSYPTLIYLLFALNLGLIFLTLTYVIGSTLIRVNNWFTRKNIRTTNKELKR